MKYKYWFGVNKPKIVYLIFLTFFIFFVFFMALLVSHDSFASILNMEQSNHSNPNTEIIPFPNTKNQKSVNPTFHFYNSFESQISRDYEFIFFYSLSCTHCQNFAPVLKRYSDGSGINVRGLILGGNSVNQESNYFPNSTIVTQEVIESFFDNPNKGKGIAVPALFIMNKKNLHTYPVSQGALTYSELVRRMNELIPKILNNEAKMTGKNHV